MSDVKAYADHPAHMEVVRKLIAPFKVARACVDYEV
ncbi:Dabb family protein [Porphyromonas loveana]